MPDRIRIEIFASTHCNSCQAANSLVEETISELGAEHFDCHTIDVVRQIDHAVALGIQATPAIAINGQLVFTSLPSRKKLYDALHLSLTEHR